MITFNGRLRTVLVVQLSVLSASADGCSQLTQATTGSEVAPKSLIFPTILGVQEYPLGESNNRKNQQKNRILQIRWCNCRCGPQPI